MPVQYTFMGRPIRFHVFPPRRYLFVVSLFWLCFLLVLLSTPKSYREPVTSRLPTSVANKLPSLPQIGPLHPAVHKPPPEQKNSTSGETRWFSDWKWHLPWSSSITLDENRAVLPPLEHRPVVYTFYEPGSKSKRGKAVLEAEDKLLLIWRRAWWAAGFTPKVLGRAEAQANPLYESMQRLRLNETIEKEAVRWLAWGHMGTGILSNWLTVPMGDPNDGLLSFLRRGEYLPKLTKYEGLTNGLFVGEKDAVNEAIKQVLFDTKLKEAKTLLEAMPDAAFNTDKAASIAFYSSDVLNQHYGLVSKQITDHEANGLTMLSALINSHLQTTWLNRFSSGVAVLKPLPDHTTALIAPGIDLARNLTQCPSTPLPSSCPPNIPSCSPCVASRPLPITTPPHFRNTTKSLFTIGVVPHPYTFTSLTQDQAVLSVHFIRRLGMFARDVWLFTVTRELLGGTVSNSARLVRFKEAVSGTYGRHRSLWLTAERETHEDLDWHFGFEIPRGDEGLQLHTSETPVPGPERRPPPPKEEGKVAKGEELERERALLRKCRDAINSKVRQMVELREAVEAWDIADTEAWHFARAYSARRRVERRKWEEEEGGFAGAEEKGGRWWGS